MTIKGCKSIAEYAFRRWMQDHLFIEEYFTLEVTGRIIKDMNGDMLKLVYDGESKCAEVGE